LAYVCQHSDYSLFNISRHNIDILEFRLSIILSSTSIFLDFMLTSKDVNGTDIICSSNSTYLRELRFDPYLSLVINLFGSYQVRYLRYR
jgi:hypothetical protein